MLPKFTCQMRRTPPARRTANEAATTCERDATFESAQDPPPTSSGPIKKWALTMSRAGDHLSPERGRYYRSFAEDNCQDAAVKGLKIFIERSRPTFLRLMTSRRAEAGKGTARVATQGRKVLCPTVSSSFNDSDIQIRLPGLLSGYVLQRPEHPQL